MEVQIEGHGLQAFAMTLDRYRQNLADATPVMNGWLDELERAAEAGFSSSRRPSGSRWKALSPDYKKWKDKHYPGAPILTREGKLRASLTSAQGQGAIRQIGTHYLQYGTRVPYARYHQSGGGRLPSRPVLPSSRGSMPSALASVMQRILHEGVTN